MTTEILYQCAMTHDEETVAFDRLLNPPERQPNTSPSPIVWKCQYCGSEGPFDADGCACQEVG